MRELRFYETVAEGYMRVTTEGDPRQLSLDVANAMQHNRMVAGIILAAAAKYMRSNNVDFKDFSNAENIPTFIPPEMDGGSAGMHLPRDKAPDE